MIYIKTIQIKFFLVFFLLVFVVCRDKDLPNYSRAKVRSSWEKSLRLLKLLPERLAEIKTEHLDFSGIQKWSRQHKDDDFCQKILEYEPVSLVFTQRTDQKDQKKIPLRFFIFEMSSPLDAWGAYSKLRNPGVPSYEHPLLSRPSEGFYNPGRLVLYQGYHLYLIEHDIPQLPLVKKIVDLLLEHTKKASYDQSLMNILPQEKLIQRSVRYYKKSLPLWNHFRNCAVGQYPPHSSIKIFVCKRVREREAKRSFHRHHKYIQNDMGLGTAKINKKEFKTQAKSDEARYFFYSSSNYELHGIFWFKNFVFGILGSHSQNSVLALSEGILEGVRGVQNGD